MSAELRQLNTRIDALELSIDSGVASISIDGQTTTFQSMSDMRARLSELKRAKETLLGLDNKKPRVSSFNMTGGV